MNLVILIIVAVLLLALLLFPEFRKKIKVLCGGFLNVFVEDAAKTPDGAKAVYQQAIEEAQEDYNKASDTLSRVVGRLDTSKRELEKAQSDLKSVETQCESLVKSGNMSSAQIKAEEREEMVSDILRTQTMIKQLEPMVEEAKTIYSATEKRLLQLKRRSKEVVESLRMNAQLKDVYNDLDDLKKSKTTDKLLDVVEEGNKSSRESVTGARIVHESKLSTRVQKADADASKLVTSNYLTDLQKKYNK